jgi:D-aspartate ligase
MHSAHRVPALVLGLGVNGYGIVRSLRRFGVPVFGAYESRDEYGRYSRYGTNVFLDTSSRDETVVAEMLVDQCRRLGVKPVLFPTNDWFAVMLANQRARLSPWCAFHWIGAEQLGLVVDKGRISRVCAEGGVLIPSTWVTTPGADLEQLVHEVMFPCLVKPANSYEGQLPGNRKNLVASEATELVSFFRAHPQMLGRTVCQQIIEGGDDDILQCTVLATRPGAPAAVATTRKLRQHPPQWGIMSFGRTEPNPEIADVTMRILRLARWVGIASLEFKHRRQDGRYYFIELNPRLPWYNILLADAGVNIPYLAYLDLTGADEATWPPSSQKQGVHWVCLDQDAGSYWRKRHAGEIGLIRWLWSLTKARSFAWLDWADLSPFLHATLRLARKAVSRLLRGR